MYFDISIVFKIYQVCGEVTICYFQHLFKIIKIYLLIHHEYAHYTQANAIIKNFI